MHEPCTVAASVPPRKDVSFAYAGATKMPSTTFVILALIHRIVKLRSQLSLKARSSPFYSYIAMNAHVPPLASIGEEQHIMKRGLCGMQCGHAHECSIRLLHYDVTIRNVAIMAITNHNFPDLICRWFIVSSLILRSHRQQMQL